jgi:hypothetical protein
MKGIVTHALLSGAILLVACHQTLSEKTLSEKSLSEKSARSPQELLFLDGEHHDVWKRDVRSGVNKKRRRAKNLKLNDPGTDHNFLRFLTIFYQKMAFFLKTNVRINFFHNLALF